MHTTGLGQPKLPEKHWVLINLQKVDKAGGKKNTDGSTNAVGEVSLKEITDVLSRPKDALKRLGFSEQGINILTTVKNNFEIYDHMDNFNAFDENVGRIVEKSSPNVINLAKFSENLSDHEKGMLWIHNLAEERKKEEALKKNNK
jgi:hypothetical protein